MQTLLIGLAGAFGAIARYRVGLAVGARSFPWATLGINVAGCFLLGILLAGPAVDRWPSSATAALGIGFLGAFTTFSTFGYEAFTLLHTGRAGSAVLYVLASMFGGLLAAGSGYATGRALL
ncbi:MAG TPA: fluoride efflux transporter CrcB [Acidimicrobiales bacterium]|nr:fluoride efflux transporter CrcB [Acidimicrobiales bacterium]